MEKLLNYSYINAMLFLATSYTEAQEGYCNFLIHDKKGFEWINNHLVRLHFPNKISKVTLVIKESVFHTVIEKIA